MYWLAFMYQVLSITTASSFLSFSMDFSSLPLPLDLGWSVTSGSGTSVSLIYLIRRILTEMCGTRVKSLECVALTDNQGLFSRSGLERENQEWQIFVSIIKLVWSDCYLPLNTVWLPNLSLVLLSLFSNHIFYILG